MSEDKLLSEYEIEAAFRMARRLRISLRVQLSRYDRVRPAGLFANRQCRGASAKKVPFGILRTLR